MKKSINQIRLELKAIATAHLQINDFAWKDFLRAYEENDLNYPLMCAYYPSGNMYMNQTQIQLNIVICDRIEKDWNKNLNEVESDTFQICRDIFNTLNESSRWQRIGRVSNCVVTKFINRGGDEVAGHTMQIDFLLRDNSGVCDVPMVGYNFDQAIEQGCPSVDVFNSDLSYSQEVASGDSLELPDIDYAVKNSLGTTLAGATVPSVTNIETTLSDVDNIDTDGSTVPTPAGVAFTCSAGADATLTLNTNSFLTVASGSTTDIGLVDQTDTPIVPDSVVGSKITVTFPTGLDAKLTQTGQTVSRMTNDDISRGRDVDFFTLNYVNEFGHSFRFCGVNGGYTDGVDYYDVNGVLSNRATEFVDGVILDFNSRNATEILTYYVNDVFTTRSAIVACTLHSASTFGGLTGWYLWNMREMFNVLNPSSFTDLTNWMGYKPFEFAVGQRYIITSTAYAPTSIIRTDLVAANPLGVSAITSALFTVFSRYTTLAELGL